MTCKYRFIFFLLLTTLISEPVFAKELSFIVVNDSSRKVTLVYMNEAGKTLKKVDIKADGDRWENDETMPKEWREVLTRRYRIQHPQTGATYAKGEIKFRDGSDFTSSKNIVWGELNTTGSREDNLLIKKWKKQSGDNNKTLRIQNNFHTH